VIKLGILDFDTSHCVEFTKRLNHQAIAADQWVEGARVIVGCPGKSAIAPGLIDGYARTVEKLGVRLVEKPEGMIGQVDGMLIESLDGSVHHERAKPILEAGIPCFIDKPFTCGAREARMLAELAARHGVPIFSSSSLRYAPEVVRYNGDPSHGALNGVFAYGPAPLNDVDPQKRNPGLYHYGIHTVEMLYALMGPGCQRVTCVHDKDVDVVTGHWRDGRIASIRGIRSGQSPYGFTAFATKGVSTVTVSTSLIYRELLKNVVRMFETKSAPLDIAVTIEIMAFIEAAFKSGNNHGTVERVSS
jgi:virulence factor